MMDAIRPWLYVGKYRETLDVDLLATKKIDAMLLLAQDVTHPGITSIYLPVEDGVPLPDHLLRRGLDFVLSAKQRGQTVLIACGAGMSRSVAYAVAALKETEALSLLQAIQTVKKHHPGSLLHPALWKSLCIYYDEDIPALGMLRALRDG
jgi:hypothetical protein